MRYKIANALASIDRRIIFLAILLAVLVPFVVKFPQPVHVSKESRDLYEWVENIPDVGGDGVAGCRWFNFGF